MRGSEHRYLLGAALALGACVTPPTPTPDAGVRSDASVRRDAGPDGGVNDGGALDGGDGGGDGGVVPPGCPTDSPPVPERVLFVGNSFTFTANMPRTFQSLAAAAGYPEPMVVSRAIGGQTLEGHRADTARDGAPARVAEGWDVVVLQELSTRPTDSIGPAEQFKVDATWFYDLAKTANPATRVLLYETFARRFSHSIYPDTFADPADMQAQLRFHYDDCADRYIPAFSTATSATDVEVARVGDAWELQLDSGEPPRLHGVDDYHPSAEGAYLTAAVFFGTVYGRRSDGLPAIGVSDEDARALQARADMMTGATARAPIYECPLVIPLGSRVAVDFGSADAPGWPAHSALDGASGPLRTLEGEPTSITVHAAGWNGIQTGGRADNTLGLPPDVSRDTLWVGSFAGHDEALPLRAVVSLRGVPEGEYELVLFASRTGDDAGAGRLTRYTVGGETRDLDVADNTSRTVTFAPLRPTDGELDIEIRVSPDGAARFAYIGALVLTRLGP